MNELLITDQLNEQCKAPSLTIGIPAGRSIDWTIKLMSKLDHTDTNTEVIIARSIDHPLSQYEMMQLNSMFTTRQTLSQLGHAPAMRNAIIDETNSTHILFLDDDMVPGQNIIASSLALVRKDPGIVYQGVPYRVANPESWLARSEGNLYRKGYQKYVDEDGNVSVLDARLMLAPTEILRANKFDESLTLGAGEGRELAKRLLGERVVLRMTDELDAAHINRDTLSKLVNQKRVHGRSLGHLILSNGPGAAGWVNYYADYSMRHFLRPAIQCAQGDISTSELVYTLGTNSVLWASAFGYMLKTTLGTKANHLS